MVLQVSRSIVLIRLFRIGSDRFGKNTDQVFQADISAVVDQQFCKSYAVIADGCNADMLTDNIR